MIEAKNVIKKYGQVTALDDFTVDIPKGKIGILGPNGCLLYTSDAADE